MLWRESGSTGDKVMGDLVAEVVFEGAFICAFKCLEKAHAKGIQNWAVCAGNHKIANECAQEDAVTVNGYLPPTFFKTNGFAAFSLQKSAHSRLLCAGS